jgi:protein-L-isoaspartate(D-aspartate) O-methyltransferase
MVLRLRAGGLCCEPVLQALGAVERHRFVDSALVPQAYEDTSLPIGLGQTISKPNVVARMIELLLAAPGRRIGVTAGQALPTSLPQLGRVLEIGAGSGYQAAVLSHLAKEVFALERIAELAAKARHLLVRELRMGNVRLRHADGLGGLPEAAPFDAIVISAAIPHIPDELLAQLAPSGRLVLPKGSAGAAQRLCLIERVGNRFRETEFDPVRFVPALLGKA